jgi:glucan 1,3-beta-glucosidase
MDDHLICNKNLMLNFTKKGSVSQGFHGDNSPQVTELSSRTAVLSASHSFLLPAMSRPTSVGHGVAYDPVPNPQELSDTPHSLYESASEQPSPAQGSPAPQMSDLNPDEPSVNLVPPPRFLGAIDGEGIRESVGTFSSRAQSEAFSSLYALNPESLSARGSPRPESQDFGSPYRDDPRALPDDPFDGPSVPLSTLSSQPRFLSEKQAVYPSKTSKSRRNTIILSALGGLLLLIVAVILPVYFLAIKHNSNKSAPSQHSGTATAPSPSGTKSPTSQNLITGGDGSTVTMEDGTTFTYHNPFGGYWYLDPNNPLANSARSQSWVPALNETFQYGTDRIRGYVTRSIFSCCYER